MHHVVWALLVFSGPHFVERYPATYPTEHACRQDAASLGAVSTMARAFGMDAIDYTATCEPQTSRKD